MPFTTITEQNAAVYRDLLDSDEDGVMVLEHHSHVEFADEEAEQDSQCAHGVSQRRAAENWDAPFVVTTTVQLFGDHHRTAAAVRPGPSGAL
ncbi:hypothetical protein LX15_004871 [Streptoalloteichus tenebrarius]|uniref:Uncharacterized protein n=1 Tax=Streptoalloteichus tenebrarius (strain ATCC 17920 / DSM 40477 / JCM 4838 / CBS 697.72 / NBRC 16177 / NCIMB 11028 / NRRL B-12390 / A12253. 1 / ISP 5477) TaxID=1933 RepID=A0ABT1I093_STRSD|nr:hypothetical protein [Streptoalloteichus tenebrarius]MCP2261151.1 hypothetical protein [Streptoalloteichus tenebrarius]